LPLLLQAPDHLVPPSAGLRQAGNKERHPHLLLEVADELALIQGEANCQFLQV
jgi:hypothetical protein